MHVVEATLARSLSLVLYFVIGLGVWVDNQLKCSIINDIVVIDPLVLSSIFPSSFGLIHYVHLTHAHLSRALSIRVHGEQPYSDSLIIANSSDNESRVSLSSCVWIEGPSVDKTRMQQLIDKVLGIVLSIVELLFVAVSWFGQAS